jgi:hypothetical protein
MLAIIAADHDPPYELPSDPAGADLLANKLREISGRSRYDDPVPQPEIVGHKQTF